LVWGRVGFGLFPSFCHSISCFDRLKKTSRKPFRDLLFNVHSTRVYLYLEISRVGVFFRSPERGPPGWRRYPGFSFCCGSRSKFSQGYRTHWLFSLQTPPPFELKASFFIEGPPTPSPHRPRLDSISVTRLHVTPNTLASLTALSVHNNPPPQGSNRQEWFLPFLSLSSASCPRRPDLPYLLDASPTAYPPRAPAQPLNPCPVSPLYRPAMLNSHKGGVVRGCLFPHVFSPAISDICQYYLGPVSLRNHRDRSEFPLSFRFSFTSSLASRQSPSTVVLPPTAPVNDMTFLLTSLRQLSVTLLFDSICSTFSDRPSDMEESSPTTRFLFSSPAARLAVLSRMADREGQAGRCGRFFCLS